MIKIKYFALISSLIFSPLVFSSDFVFFGALSNGGETLAETTDGQDLRAGGLLQFSAGIENPVSDDLVLQTMFGLKFDSITASDGDASFARYPIDVSLIKRTEKFELGMGLSYHMNPKFDINGAISGTLNFDDALGTTLAMGIRSNKAAIGARFTFIDYKGGGFTVDGNNLGLYCSLNF